MTPTPDAYVELLRAIFGGRSWLVAMDVLAYSAQVSKQLLDLGATGCFALGASRGTGEVPADLPQLALNARGDTMMAGVRAAEAVLDALPSHAMEAIDAWDPERQAQVIRTLFSACAPVARRQTYAARAPSWLALEDKLVIDALWDAAGVPRAPARNVALELGPLMAAHRELDRGLGTVWVGDNKSGWHGGAAYLRWVRDPSDAEAALAHLRTACDRARVQPFLEGIPCSIHGIVFEDYVVALRPCEMIVLRRRGTPELQYAAAATFWDPPPADRDEMRDHVRTVGRHLRDTVAYRGVFTMDGVMTADGFRPTELNPRFGAGIGVMGRGLAGLPLYLLHLAITEGEAVDWQPRQLETLLLGHADEHRAGRAGAVSTVEGLSPLKQDLVYDETSASFRACGEGEVADAQLTVGPATAGSYVGTVFAPERTPVGPSTAPRAAAALAYADDQLGAGFGPLDPAVDMRP